MALVASANVAASRTLSAAVRASRRATSASASRQSSANCRTRSVPGTPTPASAVSCQDRHRGTPEANFRRGALAVHVVQVMDDVVQEILRESQDGEH
jgi:hypothetical protein